MASRSSSLVVSRPPRVISSTHSPFFSPRTPVRPAPLHHAPLSAPSHLRPIRAATHESLRAASRAGSRNSRQRRDVSRAGSFRGWLAPLGKNPIGAGSIGGNAAEGRTSGNAETVDAAGAEDAEGSAGGARELGSSIADFLRLHEDEAAQRVELQTAVLSYRRQARWWDVLRPPVQVDLVSVVHIGDQEYYDALQAELATYDRVLYEMVADKSRSSSSSGTASAVDGSATSVDDDADAERQGARWRRFIGRKENDRWMPPKRNPKRKRRGVVGSIQSGMSKVLRLTFQLDHMDYRRDNFYHADLDFATFMKLQEERGESMWSFAREVALRSTKAIVRATTARPLAPNLGPFRRALLWTARFVPMPLVGLLVIEGVCAPKGPGSSALMRGAEFQALLNLDLSSALKVVLARQITLDTLDGAAGVMASSVIIGERNRACMEELREALSAGSRRVAIFYGSGHLPDMHHRLINELDLHPTDLSWRTAWSIRTQPSSPSSGAWRSADASAAMAATGLAPHASAAGAADGLRHSSTPSLPRLPSLSRTTSRPSSRTHAASPSLTTPTTITTPPSSLTPLPAIAEASSQASSQASALLNSCLQSMAHATGWPLTRQQTVALLLLSVVLALDLCLWEVVLGSLKEGATAVLGGVGQFLDQGWGL